MESHTFTEPELVSLVGDEGEERSSPTEPQPSSPELAWRVHVLRHGVPEPIGSILITSNTLPPRKNKAGKIVWKLPDDPNQVPKFGIHEQKRLWELYKEQKKQRRKKQSDPSKSGDAEGGDPEGADGSGSAMSKNDEETPVSPSPPRSTGQPPPSAAGTTVAETPKDSGGGPIPVSPPPGFGSTARIESLTLKETPISPAHNPQLFQQQATPQRNNRSGTHIPPPPGLTGAASAASPLTRSPALPNGNRTAQSNSQSPSRVRQGDVPRALPLVAPSKPPCNCFALSSDVEVDAYPQSVAALVAHAFQRLIAVVGAPDGAAGWLSYYAPNARSTLIMGTAQAIAHTHDERLRQWRSLSASSAAAGASATEAEADLAPGGNGGGIAGKRWECSGWTAQAVAGEAGAAGIPHDVLVVLAGRTLQQHLLSFTLTLLLQCRRPRQLNGGGQPSPPAFQISNEILSLALLT
jgi:hypothetical protein